jgi:hypothetical protein
MPDACGRATVKPVLAVHVHGAQAAGKGGRFASGEHPELLFFEAALRALVLYEHARRLEGSAIMAGPGLQR